MEQGGDVLGRSGKVSESQAERETIALVRSACQAAVSKGAPAQGMVFAGELKERNFRENPSCVLSRGTLPLVRCSSSGLVTHRGVQPPAMPV